ncbi:MAG: hypothetical protein H7A21_11995 [Spirochaetales bacterium]|nr:hypothetical protein [Leptospiraceae bacterium]MCP5482148.1 hypothetical protein [Spirochaetales bacterium]MCP5484740.1 hypothetical protein [Spirochaetales bacterium]
MNAQGISGRIRRRAGTVFLLVLFSWFAPGCFYGHPVVGILPREPDSDDDLSLFLFLFLAGGSTSSVVFPDRISVSLNSHVLFVLANGSVRAWGDGSNGRLGYDDTAIVGNGIGNSIIVEGDINFGGGTVRQVGTGNQHSCAIFTAGGARCWGFNNSGQLGQENMIRVGNGIGPSVSAVADISFGQSVVDIDGAGGGAAHTCAILADGTARCFGHGPLGALGYGNDSNVSNGIGPSISAAGAVPIGGTVTQIVAGDAHTCAVLSGGTARCWGEGDSGRTGYDATTDIGNLAGPSIIASDDLNVGGTVVQLAAGAQHTCALLSTGAVRCWGEADNGRLGYGNTTDVGDGIGPSIAAAGDVPVGGRVIQITAGAQHTCALLDTLAVRCWGEGDNGRLGYNSTADVGDGAIDIQTAGDVPVGGSVAQISAGSSTTCALLTNEAVRCWGQGDFLGLNINGTNVGDGIGSSIIAAGDVPYQ